MSMLVIVPSRGRPHNVQRLVDAIRATATTDPTIIIGLDEDDEANYPRLDGVRYSVGPRTRFCRTVNDIAVEEGPRYDYLAILGDDVVPETVGWDEQLIAAIADDPFGIAYGADGNWPNGELPTHIVVTSSMVEALGWVCVPVLAHLCADLGWKDLAEATGTLHYLPAVSMQHLHRWGDRAPDDQTYREANGTEQAAQDHTAYQEWRESPAFDDAVAALRALWD